MEGEGSKGLRLSKLSDSQQKPDTKHVLLVKNKQKKQH